MTFEQLLKKARVALVDTNGLHDSQHLLQEETALQLFNEAIHEACRRARLIVDRSTTEICSYAVTAGNPVVDIDPRIIKVRKASLVSRPTEQLRRKYVADMDELHPGWETHAGSTDCYVADYATNQLYLYRIPAATDTLKLVAVRLPLQDLDNTQSVPEIPAQYHPALVHYVVAEMRSIEDTELYDLRKADKAMARFEAEFGPKRSAQDEVWENSQPYAEYE